MVEEKDEKLNRLNEENAKLKDKLDSSISDKERLEKDLLNTSHDLEQLEYRFVNK